ncbi:FAA hydrolase family protein [Corynebacterium sp. 4HC-13]|uniref:fumarylacetoacetate hydrolase family protein n=1 Tax=Corynebacterium anserum TaxID=2684406 RepID=UPI00163993AD|nr:fumarylacetoacetate hydrolase family protein [Corynebacterium anserum]MBC2681257.1 FAA hydrolase family protein [Corynebacterium anserum]
MKIATVRVSANELVHVAVEHFESGRGVGAVVSSLFDANPADLGNAQKIEFTAQHLAPVVPHPERIFCVGLNYREHILEMGHPVPDHPTLFGKFASSITGPFDEITVDEAMSHALDYEGELAVVIGHGGEIAGYAVMNDLSQRDWQYRTQQWLQGKNLEHSSGFGPWMVTADECDPVAEGAMLRTWVNGELRQEHSVGDLVFPPRKLIDYIGIFTPLRAGDVIVTGTPEGVGHGTQPPQYLEDGDEVKIAIEGVGEICNRIRIDSA